MANRTNAKPCTRPGTVRGMQIASPTPGPHQTSGSPLGTEGIVKAWSYETKPIEPKILRNVMILNMITG